MSLTEDAPHRIPISESIEIHKSFAASSGLRGIGRSQKFVQAVDMASLSIYPGESVGLVGESGCGKSTLGRLLIRLEDPTAGTVRFDGQDITHIRGSRLRNIRRQMQMIFQDPASSLNPRYTVESTIAEAITTHRSGLSRPQLNAHIAALLDMVGIPISALNRLPNEFSSGEKQRISIARALAVEPRFLIADEPLTALDRASQQHILTLLETIQRELNVALLLIAHDMETVRRMCTRIAVMYLGRIVEFAQRDRLFDSPQHPYSRALLMSRIAFDARGKVRMTLLPGDPPSPLSPPEGCHFHPRCPYADIQCRKLIPLPRTLQDGRTVRCHFDFEGENKRMPNEINDSLKLTSEKKRP